MALPRRLVTVLLLIVAAVFIFSFFHKAFNIDEGMIGEHAWWVSQGKHVRSQMGDGLGLGIEQQQYHYHKLFVLAGGLDIRLFGLSLFGLRALTLGCFIAFAFLLRRCMRQRAELYDTQDYLLCLLVLLLNATLFDFAFLYRPEVMVMLLGFCSYYFLMEYERKQQSHSIYIAAAFAGLAALAHLNGLIFLFAGGILLLSHKKWGHAIGFGLVGSLIFLLYFYDTTSMQALHTFWFQFTHDPTLEAQQHHWYTPLSKLADEHMRFFHSPREIVFSVLMLLSLLFNFKYLRKTHGSLLLYLLALVVCLGMVSHGKTAKYAILEYPYIAIIITVGIRRMLQAGRVQQIAWIVCLLGYVGVNAYYDWDLITHYQPLQQQNAQAASYLSKNHPSVLTQEAFLFNEAPDVTIHSPFTFTLLYNDVLKQSITQQNFFAFARARTNDYIVINPHFWDGELMHTIGYDTMRPGMVIEHYKVIARQPDFTVLQRID